MRYSSSRLLDETLSVFAPFTLAPVADRIRQDVLILAGTEEVTIAR